MRCLLLDMSGVASCSVVGEEDSIVYVWVVGIVAGCDYGLIVLDML